MISNKLQGISICIILLFALSADLFSAQTPPISAMRIQKISRIISTYKEAGEDLNDSDVQKAIMKQVAEQYKLEPEAKKNSKTTQEIGKMVREKVTLKFPDSYDDLKKKAEAEAGKTFQMAKILDYVTVRYLRGEKSYEADGYFFSYGSTGHSINVGGTTIAIFDIIPDDRVKFDEVYRNQKKDTFVQTKIRDYYSRKNAYSVSIYNEIKDALVKENEDNGYVFYNNDWRNAKEVATMLCKDIQAEETAMPVPVPDKKTPTSPDKVIPTDPGTPEPKGGPALLAADKKKLDALKKKAEEIQLQNSTKFAGIDADQGYELAYWRILKDDFALLYPQYVKSAEGDAESLAFDSGPIQKLDFHFFNKYFYKVVFDFRVQGIPREALVGLGRKLREKYGLTDEEKAEAADPAKANRQEPCEAEHDFDKDGACKKCGWTQAELEIPSEQTYTWTGETTKGQLYIKLNAEKTSYVEFRLTKEDPTLKDTISAEIDKKKKADEEEKKKKILEEYNKFK
ncbi:MAG TPA: hypothetical protein DET40_03080 [Lentisphaeria bacterium]|nr:MAG: hypothetical protein A2X45_12950 [Lentisphaerae bacterium GWF2_50_93]HCE42514.1 hypothetical protein [Lentisphaeria bacterium]